MTTDYFKRVESLNCWEHTIHCEPLEGGITNRNFLVEHGNEKFFVRLGVDIPEHGVYRFNELAASRAPINVGFHRKLCMQKQEQWFCDSLMVKLWNQKTCEIFQP